MHLSRIRLRAERRLGQLLKITAENGERRLAEQGRPSEASRGGTPTLTDFGVPRDRASRAMQLANIPEEQFEAALAEPVVAGPREILEQLKPPKPPELVPNTKTLLLWGRVRDFGEYIEAGEMPPIANWCHNLQPFQLDHLRRYIPLIIGYLSARKSPGRGASLSRRADDLPRDLEAPLIVGGARAPSPLRAAV
jgi:hypothetical protein